MPRAPRSLLNDGVFHVTARGVAGGALFCDETDRVDFLVELTRTASALLWTCHVYCLMTTHYHLLLETSRDDLSRGMQRLNGLYAQRFNARHGRRGHVFEQRFQAYTVEGDDHFAAATKYILENPLKAGLCEAIRDWPWSGGPLHLGAPLAGAEWARALRE
jgi:REP-associated tyrosine transposase